MKQNALALTILAALMTVLGFFVGSGKGARQSNSPIQSGDRIYIQTRLCFYLNSHDSTGPVKTISTFSHDPNHSDEIFTIQKLSAEGPINSGDKVYIKTRKGFFFNSHASTGPVKAIPTYSHDPNHSDEIFLISKISGGQIQEGPINSGDKVLIITRRGYFFNSHASTGPVKAIPTYSHDSNHSDEIFILVKTSDIGCTPKTPPPPPPPSPERKRCEDLDSFTRMLIPQCLGPIPNDGKVECKCNSGSTRCFPGKCKCVPGPPPSGQAVCTP